MREAMLGKVFLGHVLWASQGFNLGPLWIIRELAHDGVAKHNVCVSHSLVDVDVSGGSLLWRMGS